MSHYVALIDADVNFNEQLAQELSRDGYRVATFEDSNVVLAQTEDLPDLIVLSIDPKPAGWAICDRIRKSPIFKSVPIIIVSAEATEADYESHKKLKKRADDYLHKPFTGQVLSERVRTLIGSPDASMTHEIAIDAAEISVEDSDVQSKLSSFGEDDLDDQTQMRGIGGQDEVPTQTGSEEPPLTVARVTTVKRAVEVPRESVAIEFDAPPTNASHVDLDLGLDEVAKQSADAPKESAVGGDVGHSPSEFRRERDQLAREVEELRGRLASRPESQAANTFSREKEFLNLREIINKKEKEILDLRDAASAKERQLLDGTDKLRDAERRGRDLDSRTLGTERELVETREQVENLGREKSEGIERERVLRNQLDEADKLIARGEKEVETWKQRHTQMVTQHETELRTQAGQWEQKSAQERGQFEQQRKSEVAAVEERRKNELQAAEERRLGELSEREAQHRAELEQVLRENLKEREQLEADHQKAVHSVDAAHRQELEEREAQKASELDALKTRLEGENNEAIAAARESHASKVQALEEAHADQKAGMQARHTVQVDELKRAQADVERQLADEQSGSKAKSEQLTTLEGQIAAALSQAKDREAKIKAYAQRVEELEQESAQFQEQILKAYQRIKNDESVVSRAKKAMAIAITLLDETDEATAKPKPST